MALGVPADWRGGQGLWRAIEAHRDEMRGSVQVRGVELGVEAALATAIGNMMGAPAQHRALCDGDWDGFVHELKVQAGACAESGLALHIWFDLLEAGLGTLQNLLGPEKGTVDALAHLRELTMSQLGAAYVQARARITNGAEPEGRLFQLLFANSSMGTLIYRFEDRSDPMSFRLVCANAAAARVSHPRIFEHVGKQLRETSPYLLETDVPRHYANAALLGNSASWVISTGTEALARKTYSARCFPLDGDYIAVTFEDITLRCEVEQRAERHVTELERSNRELDDFAHAASHDLKGPLQDVKSLATWIQEDLGPALPDNTARHMRTMLDRVFRMERLLDDLLEYSRAGRAGATVEEFELRDLFDDVLALTRIPDGFEVRLSANVQRLRTPMSPLAQVLRNLVGNAIKHHDRPVGTIELAASDEGQRVRILVRDDGPGIPPEFHGRVFRIFQTLRPRDEVEGSGIGLAIVKKVIESHGGTVTVDSVGRGTAIHFTWPKESEN